MLHQLNNILTKTKTAGLIRGIRSSVIYEVIIMPFEQYDLFNKHKPTPAKDSCGLCDPEKSEDEATRICSYCTQTLIKIKPSMWDELLEFSIEKEFPAWFITFCGDRADYFKSKTPITIKDARFNAKLTQKQFADLLGVPVRTIQRWEARDKVADMKVLRACY